MSDQLESFLIKDAAFSKHLAQEISANFTESNYQRRETILGAGEICRKMFFIEEGCIRIYCLNDEGQEWTRYVAFENEFVTVIPSFINQVPSRSNLESVEPSKLQSISFNGFKQLIHTYPQWEKLYRLSLEQAYIKSIERIERLIMMDSKTLYNAYRRANSMMVNRLPNKVLASYFGISAETLSRIKIKSK